MPTESKGAGDQWVLQFCHGYDGPFLDCARQYAALFAGSPYKICTVYLTGAPDEEVVTGSASDEVIFLAYNSKQIRGLKLDAIRRIRQIVGDGRDFRFCIAHRFKPIFISLMATNLPVIGIHHAFGVYNRVMRRWFVNLHRSRLLLLGVSDAVRDDIRARLPNWPPTHIQTLYNRIDVDSVQHDQLSKEEARAFLGLPMNIWIIGNVGRLHPDKDQKTLIQGFAVALPTLPPQSKLVIMGNGRLEGELKALVDQLGLSGNVHFAGQVKNGRRYFKAFDAFALTSDHEPFGMVLLEAMAAGVPIVSSDCGGAAEIVSGLGSLFPLCEPRALAECLVELSSYSTEELEALRRLMLKKLYENYSDDSVRSCFFDVLAERNYAR